MILQAISPRLAIRIRLNIAIRPLKKRHRSINRGFAAAPQKSQRESAASRKRCSAAPPLSSVSFANISGAQGQAGTATLRDRITPAGSRNASA
jgi:hypothetical protein